MAHDRLPFVIDNQQVKLADVVNRVMLEVGARALDVATAYFTVGGFQVLREGLLSLRSFRLLLGAPVREGADVGLRPVREEVRGLLRADLAALPYDEATCDAVEDLIAFLERDSVAVRVFEGGFLHAKCYLFFGDEPSGPALFDRFRPLLAVVGSSNMTRPGLTTNRELNLVHRVVLSDEELQDQEARRALGEQDAAGGVSGATLRRVKGEVGARAILDLREWYERQWADARDFKADLVRLLDESKFGRVEYTPYQVYLKALYEYFKDEIGAGDAGRARPAVELTEFQEDAVRKARTILDRYDGVLVADSVGLGKTWIGKRLLDDLAYHERGKAVVVCPASIREMWERELRDVGIAAKVLTHEEMGREEFDARPWSDADVVLVDESHNFRNPDTGRYEALWNLLAGNDGRGRAGRRKKVILLTATPIHNDLMDLYRQIDLIALGDRSYFAGAGIGDLLRFFRRIRGDAGRRSEMFNLLEEVAIRRTRPFIRRAYPGAVIQGRPVRFPERRLGTITYDLEKSYQGIYDHIVSAIEGLHLAPYNLQAYRKEPVDDLTRGRGQALVGIFKSRLLKRLESSVHALKLSVRGMIRYFETFYEFILDDRVLTSDQFRKARSLLKGTEEDLDGLESLAERMEQSEAARGVLDGMEEVEPGEYDLRRLHRDIEADLAALRGVASRIEGIGPAQDAKAQVLLARLRGDLRGRKLLIFSYYRDTARYLKDLLTEGLADTPWTRDGGPPRVREVDSGMSPRERKGVVEAFAPVASGLGREPAEAVDILVSTDALAEGHNLQDCGVVLNYDLHWNPMRMVQRAGRIDRLCSPHAEIRVLNLFPERRLEDLLGLVARLEEKARQVDKAGMMDSPIFEGQTVNPREFNTLRRIRDEDVSVLDDIEEEGGLPTSEFLLQELRESLARDGLDAFERLPDGIHSGRAGRGGAGGVFFYFRAERDGRKQDFWRFVEAGGSGRVLDDRFEIARLIQCGPDEPRVMDGDLRSRVFEMQERAVAHILNSVAAQAGRERVPPKLAPEQTRATRVLEGLLDAPDVDPARVRQAVSAVEGSLSHRARRRLREALRRADEAGDARVLLNEALALGAGVRPFDDGSTRPGAPVWTRDDLRLVCFEFIRG